MKLSKGVVIVLTAILGLLLLYAARTINVYLIDALSITTSGKRIIGEFIYFAAGAFTIVLNRDLKK